MENDRRWLMCQITSDTRKGVLIELAQLIPEKYRHKIGIRGKRTKADFREYIERSRQLYWNGDQSEGFASDPKPSARAAPRSKVNDVFLTMPPVPPYPEKCKCAMCAEQTGGPDGHSE